MKVYIYCIIDKMGVPLYIGKTKNTLKQRKSQHQLKLKEKIDIFELDLVGSNEWKYWESYWINQFKSWGFNLLNKNHGGGGPEYHTRLSRKKMSSTPRPKTSIALKGSKRPDVSKRMKGKKFSEKTKTKISQSKKNHSCYTLERTEKIKSSNKVHYKLNSNRNKKISQKLQGRKCPWLKKLGKSIIQLDKEEKYIAEFKSISEASRSLNKPTSAISECCSGKRKTAYGYKWKYK